MRFTRCRASMRSSSGRMIWRTRCARPTAHSPGKELFESTLTRIRESAQRNRLPCGLHVLTAADALKRAKEGWQFIAVGSELKMMLDGATDVCRQIYHEDAPRRAGQVLIAKAKIPGASRPIELKPIDRIVPLAAGGHRNVVSGRTTPIRSVPVDEASDRAGSLLGIVVAIGLGSVYPPGMPGLLIWAAAGALSGAWAAPLSHFTGRGRSGRSRRAA